MLYRNGRYSVEVGSDGAIKVRPGDWLSKYSAAMFNTFWRVNEFGRRGPFGMEPIQNVSLIHAGETIYHIPTYDKSRPPGTQSTRLPAPPLSDSEKKELIKSTLAHDFHLRGDQLAALGTAIDILGKTDDVLTLAEIAGLLSETGLMSVVASRISIASVILFPVDHMIKIVNCLEAGQRLEGIMAVAYTITAWAFDDPIPKQLPPQHERNIKVTDFDNQIPAYRKAWQDASNATLNKLNEMKWKQFGVPERSYQVALRAAGDNNRQTLCRALLRGFEKGLTKMQKEILRTRKYPN